uniref:Proteasome alpha-type subunits domain-containing protein n=1 Tax=Ditylum brightwellii TaxID=49249 RepID=A0A7S4WAH2_9STRA
MHHTSIMMTLPSFLSLRCPVIYIFSSAILLLLTLSAASASSPGVGDIGGRYSFSLTTFDPSGRLSQVSHATRASTLGPPIIALTHPKYNAVLLCSPHAVPSPLVRDDGTCRFVSITPSISMCHSGIGADGRVIIDAALKCAIEHSYTYDEDVSIDTFLENLSLLFQEYTMKPGCRPFGCSVLVCYLPPPHPIQKEDGDSRIITQQPCIFRIDPSGAVELMVGGAASSTIKAAPSMAYIGRNSAKIAQGISDDLQLDGDKDTSKSLFCNAETMGEAKKLFITSFRKQFGQDYANSNDNDSDDAIESSERNNESDKKDFETKYSVIPSTVATTTESNKQPLSILVAMVTHRKGLSVKMNPLLPSAFPPPSKN